MGGSFLSLSAVLAVGAPLWGVVRPVTGDAGDVGETESGVDLGNDSQRLLVWPPIDNERTGGLKRPRARL
jgi:hypothetical protein